MDSAILEAWLACRLILLDENPRVRPPDVCEILSWIAVKVVVAATCNDVITNIVFLQWSISLYNALTLQRGKNRRRVISWCWKCDNAVNRKAFLHSVNIICSSIPSFVHNWYSKPTHLFVIGVVEIPSSEGTMQVYPAAIAIYAKIIVSLILIILKSRSTWNNHMELQKYLIIQIILQQQHHVTLGTAGWARA